MGTNAERKASVIKDGEVWMADFPYEEDNTIVKYRPVVILDVNQGIALSTKVTTSEPRDKYDVKIIYWSEAGLRFESTARASKTIFVPKTQFKRRLGELKTSDFETVKQKFTEYVTESAQQQVAATTE